MLKYGGYQTACDIAFGVFIVTWFVARHIFYLAVCWSIWADVPIQMPYGCYNAQTGAKLSSAGGTEILSNVMHAYGDSADPVCFNSRIQDGFLGLLLALQVITILWFGMICRVAYSVLRGNPADDSRSDDEEGDEREDEDMDEESEESASDARDRIKDFSQKQPELDLKDRGRDRSGLREEEAEVGELRFEKRQVPRKRKTKGRGVASGISIAGAGDRKELLGRIGCDKPN